MIGMNVTEMIAEIVVARKLETTGMEMIKSIHPIRPCQKQLWKPLLRYIGEVIHL